MTSKYQLSTILRALFELQGARVLLESVIEGQTAVLGPDDASTLATKVDLANVMQQQGHHREARALKEGIVEALVADLGASNPATLNAKANLAIAMKEEGCLREAILLLQEVVEAQAAQLGADHLQTLNSKGNLGLFLKDEGQLAASRELIESALEGLAALPGDVRDPHATANIRRATACNKGNLLMLDAIEAENRGERAAASDLYRAAADMREVGFGEESPYVAECRAKARELS